MNKLLTKIAAAFVGMAMAVGVGVVAGQKKESHAASAATEYVLVKDINDLAAEDKVVIGSGTSGDIKLMSTTQNNSNRGSVAASVTDGAISSLPTGAQVIELGKSGDNWTLSTGTAGYLYASSSSSNQLKTKTDLDDNGKWAITISSAGVASLTAQGSNSRKVMQFNPNSGNPIFACYGSASQTSVSLYKETEVTTGVDAVIALINAIGEVEFTSGSKEKIDAARKAYDGLDEATQAEVTNYATLTAAEARYAELKDDNDKAEAADVDLLIDAIGEVTSWEAKASIDTARAAFDALSEEAQAYVTKLAVLAAAEEKVLDYEPSVVDYTMTSSDNASFELNSLGGNKIAQAAFDKGTTTTNIVWNADDNGVRFYVNQMLRITPSKGYVLDSVTLTFKVNQNNKGVAPEDLTYFNGLVAEESFAKGTNSIIEESEVKVVLEGKENYIFSTKIFGSAGNIALQKVYIEYSKLPAEVRVSVQDDKTALTKGEEVALSTTLVYGATGTPSFVGNNDEVITVTDNGDGTAKVSAVAAGTAKVTVSLAGCDDVVIVFEVSEDPVLNSIAVKTMPTKTEYIVGEQVDKTGLVVTATYSDSSTKDVEAKDLVLSNDTASAKGENTVTVSYTDNEVTKSTTFVVTAQYPLLTIDEAIAKIDDKDEGTYRVKGIVSVIEEWSTQYKNANVWIGKDYSSKEFELFRISDKDAYDALKIGSEIVVESKLSKYNSIYETTANPLVVSYDANPEHIILSLEFTAPTKVEYVINETLDTTGMVVKTVDNYGEKETITEGFTLSQVDLSTKGTKEVTVTHTASSLTAKFSITVTDPVGDAKVAGKAELEQYATAKGEANYSAENWTTLQGYVTTAKNGIDSAECNTVEAVALIVASAKEQIDDVETLAQALAQAKEGAKLELNNYADGKGEANYSAENWTTLQGYVTEGETAIDSAECNTVEAVALIVAAQKAKIDDIETLAQALAQAKEGAKLELNNYADGKGEANYSADNWTKIQGFVTEGENAIDATDCDTVAKVNAALAAAKEKIDAVPTSAQDLAQAKAAAKAALDDYAAAKGEANYSAKGWAAIQAYLAQGKDAIDSENCNTAEKIERASNAAKSLIDTVKVKSQEELDDAKDAAHEELAQFYNAIDASKYTQENVNKMAEELDKGKAAINAATTVAEVRSAVDAAKAAINAIPQVTPSSSGGCGGSIVATSVILSSIALVGAGLLVFRKRKED